MRSLSFLLVTYYAVLRLFVTQIVLDVSSPLYSFRPFAVAGARTIKNCVAGEIHEKRNREEERETKRGAFNQRPKALNDSETNLSSLHTLSNFLNSGKLWKYTSVVFPRGKYYINNYIRSAIVKRINVLNISATILQYILLNNHLHYYIIAYFISQFFIDNHAR